MDNTSSVWVVVGGMGEWGRLILCGIHIIPDGGGRTARGVGGLVTGKVKMLC